MVVDVSADDSMYGVAKRLKLAGLVRFAQPFAAYGALRGAGDQLRAGRHYLDDGMTPAMLLRHLAEGMGPAFSRVTVPEGYNTFQIAKRLEERRICDAAAFVKAASDPKLLQSLGAHSGSAEGYLFPDTYELKLDSSCRWVVRRMFEHWRIKILELISRYPGSLAELKRELSWSTREVVILASVVEKEAGSRQEKERVAGVFLNRLKEPAFRPKRLQADPTVAYGCLIERLESCPKPSQPLTAAALRDSSNRYNTYRHDGLPPGPISNPGLGALKAVLRPESHDYLYFVSRGDGTHHFSRTLSEHQRAVRRYRVQRRSR